MEDLGHGQRLHLTIGFDKDTIALLKSLFKPDSGDKAKLIDLTTRVNALRERLAAIKPPA